MCVLITPPSHILSFSSQGEDGGAGQSDGKEPLNFLTTPLAFSMTFLLSHKHIVILPPSEDLDGEAKGCMLCLGVHSALER